MISGSTGLMDAAAAAPSGDGSLGLLARTRWLESDCVLRPSENCSEGSWNMEEGTKRCLSLSSGHMF